MEKIVGIYHRKCADGSTAATVLLSQFPNVDLYPLAHGYEESELTEILQK